MTEIIFIDHEGSRKVVDAKPGTTLMRAALDNNVSGIIGECGGSCSCGTCHCFIEEPWASKVSVAEDLEKDTLECAVEMQVNSRLSCQIIVQDELNGMEVTLPESQF
ncbi:MAG: 2Fe-2S ferredoxin [Marinomonas primoryensis]|jgi:2Fe-2S ferredoxin